MDNHSIFTLLTFVSILQPFFHASQGKMSVSAGSSSSRPAASLSSATRSTPSFSTRDRSDERGDLRRSLVLCTLYPDKHIPTCIDRALDDHKENPGSELDTTGTVRPGTLSPEALAAMLRATTITPRLTVPTPVSRQDDSDDDDDYPGVVQGVSSQGWSSEGRRDIASHR